MLSVRSLAPVSGLLAAVQYPLFATLAYAHYPSAYSPMRNWLSDLGSPYFNPHGAFCYDIGVILTGLLLMAFFAGTSYWLQPSPGGQRILARLTQVCGVLGAVAVALTGIVTEAHPARHDAISAALFLLLGTALICSFLALGYARALRRRRVAFGALLGASGILGGALLSVHLAEWILTALFLVYACLLSLVAHRRRALAYPALLLEPSRLITARGLARRRLLAVMRQQQRSQLGSASHLSGCLYG